MSRWLSILAALGLFSTPVYAADSPLHLEWAGATLQSPSSGDAITERLEDTGRRMATMKAQGPRTAHYDYVYPLTLDEYRALGDNGVILISAVAHDPKEFPLKRAYLRVGDREVALTRLSGRLSEVSPTSTLIATIGSNRDDEFFLLPGYLAGQEADLLIDFGANRTAFSVAHLKLALPNALQPAAETLPGAPDEAALKILLAREYPNLVQR